MTPKMANSEGKLVLTVIGLPWGPEIKILGHPRASRKGTKAGDVLVEGRSNKDNALLAPVQDSDASPRLGSWLKLRLSVSGDKLHQSNGAKVTETSVPPR